MPAVTLTVNGYTFWISHGDGLIIHPDGVEWQGAKFNQHFNYALTAAMFMCPQLMTAFEIYVNVDNMTHYASRLSDDELERLRQLFVFPGWIQNLKIEYGHGLAHTLQTVLAEKQSRHKKRQHAERNELKKNPPQKHGYVYLIQSISQHYKIGRTRNPKDRLRTFNVKLPFEVDFIAVIRTKDMFSLEAELHQRFGDKRINGEWFDLSPDDVAYIKNLAVAHE